jgi:hypothetical protein
VGIEGKLLGVKLHLAVRFSANLNMMCSAVKPQDVTEAWRFVFFSNEIKKKTIFWIGRL